VLEFLDLVLLRGDVSFKFLDLVVQHEFELFKFLGLFLQSVNLLFPLRNLLVLLTKRLLLLCNLLFEELAVGILLLVLVVLILNLSLERVDFIVDVAELITGQLKLCFALQTHVIYLGLVVVVLAGDVRYFEGGVLPNLGQDFDVFPFCLLDFAFHLVDLRVLDFNFLAVGLLLGLDLLQVVPLDLVERVLVHQALFFLLDLQLVKPSGILKHFLTVLISLLLDYFLLSIK
jgi:hypothetical protein